MTLNDILESTLGRLEESLPTDTPPGPIFWNLIGEVYVAMVDAMNEAALVTGTVQQSNVLVTLQPNQNYFNLQGTNVGYGQGGYGEYGYGGSDGIPKGVLAALRLKQPYVIRKTTLNALDSMIPNWQQTTPSTQIVSWFPLGISGFGIYPALSVESTVTMDFLMSPVLQPRPYNGEEQIPFLDEYADLISMYAAACLRSKETGAEAEEGETVFMAYMSRLKALSAYQSRVDSLVYSRAFGAAAQVNDRKLV